MDGNIASLAQGQFVSPGLQYSTYPYQVPDGHGALAAYYAANQQLAPQSWFVNPLAQGIQPIGGGFGNPQFGGVLGGWGGQLPNYMPISATGQFLSPTVQPIGGVFGQQTCAIPGSLVGGYATPYQLGNQGCLGNFIGQVGQPIGSVFGSPFGVPQIGGTLGGFGNQLSGFTPIAVTPQAAQAAQVVAQQAAQAGQLVANQAAQQAGQQTVLAGQQVAHQAAQQAGQQVAIVAQQIALQAAQQAAQVACQVAHQAAQQAAQQIATGSTAPLMYNPTNVLGAQYVTPQQLAAQNWFGNILGQQPRPIGLTNAAIYGYPQFGNPLGVLPGQLPWSAVPFSTLPQSVNQTGFGSWIGTPSGAFGVLQPGIAPLNPYVGAPIGSQTQLTASPRFSFA